MGCKSARVALTILSGCAIGFFLCKWALNHKKTAYTNGSSCECPSDPEQRGYADACDGCPNKSLCQKGPSPELTEQKERIAASFEKIKHVILVVSGKGGVGKSTVSSELAYAISKDKRVGLLDVDICGPSIPHLTQTVGRDLKVYKDGWHPVKVSDNLKVASIGYMIDNADRAVMWRGPRKNTLIRQFLTELRWDELDYLVIDTPPGTSDEHLSIVDFMSHLNKVYAIVVSTPHALSALDVRKELNFCKEAKIPVIGVIENMASGLLNSSEIDHIQKLCNDMNVEKLISIPLSQAQSELTNKGLDVESVLRHPEIVELRDKLFIYFASIDQITQA